MVSRSLLKEAASQGVIEESQVEPLFQFLDKHAFDKNSGSRFNLTHALYYFGGLIAIGALTLFVGLGWEQFGGKGILAISAVYGVLALAMMVYFGRTGRETPASLCGVFVVALVPLAIYGFQQAMGWWPDNKNYQDFFLDFYTLGLTMEVGALLAAIALLRVLRHSLQTLPVAIALWLIAMDMVGLFYGADFSWQDRSLVTLWFGLGMTVMALVVDIATRKTKDFAFWFYLIGVTAFWGGVTAQDSSSELSRFFYFCFNLLMIGCGVVLLRKVFIVVGTLGACYYLTYLANQVFRDSWMFPIVLTVGGFAVVWLGVFWQKNEAAINATIRAKMPKAINELLVSRY